MYFYFEHLDHKVESPDVACLLAVSDTIFTIDSSINVKFNKITFLNEYKSALLPKIRKHPGAYMPW